MRDSWIGLGLCVLVLYFGIVHSLSNPLVLLNAHAIILVCGGTVAIAFLTYAPKRLMEVIDYVLFGFLFRWKKTEITVAKELICCIDQYYERLPSFPLKRKAHPFLVDAVSFLNKPKVSAETTQETLVDRRNAVKRKFLDDAKILNNLAKYPPHLGLLGAASGMIEMMSGLGVAGTETIGASMAIALSATLWGVGLNNFVFLPLADNAMKAVEDEMFLRDIIIECAVMMKTGSTHEEVVKACVNKLSLMDSEKLIAELSVDYASKTTNYAA